MHIRVTDYFDVWGNAEEGWEVNNQCHTEHTVKIKDIWNNKSLLKLMKRLGYIVKGVRTTQLTFDHGLDNAVEMLQAKDQMPMFLIEELKEEKNGNQDS